MRPDDHAPHVQETAEEHEFYDPSKSYMKIMGSFGPAGSLVTLCERIIRSVFSDAYYQESEYEALRLKGEN